MKLMQYKNGREAKDGDDAVCISDDGGITFVGKLYAINDDGSATLGMVLPDNQDVKISECLHADDVASIVKREFLYMSRVGDPKSFELPSQSTSGK
jgi:hypothetical protein